eukprot:3507734-Heterocapsa_arctica.AAC.1
MYDFPLTQEGYQDMAQGIGKHGWNIHVRASAHDAERLEHTAFSGQHGITEALQPRCPNKCVPTASSAAYVQ